jgi:hypothetical protein
MSRQEGSQVSCRRVNGWSGGAEACMTAARVMVPVMFFWLRKLLWVAVVAATSPE